MIAKAFAGLAFLLAVIAAALFVPARTLDYWQAWMVLATFGASNLAITIYLAVRDPALLARRTKAGPIAEPTLAQKIIQSIASLAFVAVFVVAGLHHADRRVLAIAGDVLIVLGLVFVALVFRANTFTSATVEVKPEQQLVSTGPYAIVRHPMYAGALLMLLGVPLALASWPAFIPVAVIVAVIVVRLLAEEKLLVVELAGYAEYRERVRYRLIPFVW